MQDLRGDRVEEGLGQLGLVVLDQQPDGVQLDLMPGLARQLRGLELGVEALDGLVHAQVVERDAIALRIELALPVGLLETPLGRARRGREQLVVTIEAFDDRFGDGEGVRVIQLVRKHAEPVNESGVPERVAQSRPP